MKFREATLEDLEIKVEQWRNLYIEELDKNNRLQDEVRSLRKSLESYLKQTQVEKI